MDFDTIMDFGFALEAFESFEFIVIVTEAQLFGVDQTDGFGEWSRVVIFKADFFIVEFRALFAFHKI